MIRTSPVLMSEVTPGQLLLGPWMGPDRHKEQA